jgi:hypothetical protein
MRKYNWRDYQDKATDLHLDEDNHLTLDCTGVDCPEEITMGIPVGWTGTHDLEGYYYCPKDACQAQSRWLDNQCPGCTGLYPDCGLGRLILTRENLGLNADQEIMIKSGKCPFRHSGTLFVTNTTEETKLESIDLSTKADESDGALFVKAINSYCERWKREDNKRFWWPWKVYVNSEGKAIKAELLKDEEVPKEYWDEEPPKLIQKLDSGNYLIFVWSIKRHFALHDAEVFFEHHLKKD